MPKGLPRRATRAPSPPEEPPEVSERLLGLTVRPKTLLNVSGHYDCRSISRVLQYEQRTYHEGLRNIRLHKWVRTTFE